MNSTAITTIVEFLGAGDSEKLRLLRSRYPEHASLLKPGLVMGINESGPSLVPEQLYCDLALEGVQSAKSQLEIALREIPRRVDRAKRWKLYAAIIATITSVGLIPSILLAKPPWSIVVAGLNLVVTSINLLASYIETPLTGERSLADMIAEGIKIESDLRTLEPTIIKARLNKSSECEGTMPAVADLCARVRYIVVFGQVRM